MSEHFVSVVSAKIVLYRYSSFPFLFFFSYNHEKLFVKCVNEYSTIWTSCGQLAGLLA